MNKSLVSIVALMMVLTMVSPALAGTMGTVSTVNNVAPEIDCGSFSMEIVSPCGDVLWNAAGDGVRGGLVTPYIVDGETVYYSVDVSDGNGESDLVETGTVAVGFFETSANTNDWTTASAVIRLGADSSTTGDADIDSMSFLVDKTMSENLYGEYVVCVGASDSWYEDPELNFWWENFYADDQCTVGNVYMNPVIGLDISCTDINFGAQNPGTMDVSANQNPITVTNSGDFNVIEDVLVSADDMTKANFYLGNGLIPAENMFLTDLGASAGTSQGSFTMSTISQLAVDDLPQGETWEFGLDLDFPSTLPDGNYEGQFFILAELQ